MNYELKKVKYIFCDGESIFINVINKLTDNLDYRVVFENNEIAKILKHNFKLCNYQDIWIKTKELNSTIKKEIEVYFNTKEYDNIEILG
jgi:hypothetical protein